MEKEKLLKSRAAYIGCITKLINDTSQILGNEKIASSHLLNKREKLQKALSNLTEVCNDLLLSTNDPDEQKVLEYFVTDKQQEVTAFFEKLDKSIEQSKAFETATQSQKNKQAEQSSEAVADESKDNIE